MRENEITDIAEGYIPKKTLGEAFERYATEVNPKKRGGHWEVIRLNKLRSTAGGVLKPNLRLRACSSDLLARCRDGRLSEVSDGSVLHEIALLSAVFERARKEWGWLRDNPVKGISRRPKPAHRDKVLTRPEMRKILRALGDDRETASGRVALVFAFALCTGMRAGEICGMQWSHVHDSHVVLPMTKNGTLRNVPLSRKAKLILERARGIDEASCFGVAGPTLDTIFRRGRDPAGVTGVHFHDTRHYAATQLAKKLSMLELCRMFGWRDPKHALIYFNATAADLAKLLDK